MRFYDLLVYVSGLEKRGHLGPDLIFEILIGTKITRNQMSFLHGCSELPGFSFYERLYKMLWQNVQLRKSQQKCNECIASNYIVWQLTLNCTVGCRKRSTIFGTQTWSNGRPRNKVNDNVIKLFLANSF